MHSQPESSKSTGPMCDGGETCETSRPSPLTTGSATLSAGASPAKTLAHATTRGRDLMVRGRAYGLSLHGSFAHFSPDSSLLKTCQRSLFGGSIEFSSILPRAGTMRNGILYPLDNLAHRNSEIDFSLWPIPQASDGRRIVFSIEAHKKQQQRNKRLGFGCGPAGGNLVAHCQIEFGGVPTASFVEWLMNFPIGWSDIESSATPSSPKSLNG